MIERPTEPIDILATFGFSTDLRVFAFAERNVHVPEIDPAYRFDPDIT